MGIEELTARFGLALGIGLLLGLERGWRRRDVGPGKRAAGSCAAQVAPFHGAGTRVLKSKDLWQL